jgi:thioredoxin reductase (NADPH)
LSEAQLARLRAYGTPHLVDRLLANPKITVRGGTEVTRLDGEEALESIAMVGPAGELHEQGCGGLFCFIGAEPATSRRRAGLPVWPSMGIKRVAAAVGEGASAVRSVHTAIGVRA